MVSTVVSILNTLDGSVYGLERTVIGRYEALQELNTKHIVLVYMGDGVGLSAEYLESFGDEVIFLGGQQGITLVESARLLVEALVSLRSQYGDDILILHDEGANRMPKLYEYIRRSKANYYKVIHYDISCEEVYGHTRLENGIRYLVASEWLVDYLRDERGIESQFLQPAYSDYVIDRDRAEPVMERWVYVGNSLPLKRTEWLLEAFADGSLADLGLSVDIYGSLPSGVEPSDLPPGIEFKGKVPKVTYHEYDGYISCSSTECFANACVEASGHGLSLVLSRNKCHDFYASLDSSVSQFSSPDELKTVLSEIGQHGGASTPTLGYRYRWENFLEGYRKLLEVS